MRAGFVEILIWDIFETALALPILTRLMRASVAILLPLWEIRDDSLALLSSPASVLQFAYSK